MRHLLLCLITCLATTIQAQQVSSFLFQQGSLEDAAQSDNRLTAAQGVYQGVPDREGTANSAIHVNGDVLTSGFSETHDDYSVSFWVKTNTTDAVNRSVLHQYGGSTAGYGPYGYRMFINNGELKLKAQFYFYSYYNFNSTNNRVLSDPAELTHSGIADDQWHHVVLTFDYYIDSYAYVTYKMYVDNTLSQEVTIRGIASDTYPDMRTVHEDDSLQIGHVDDADADLYAYNDYIDDVQLYSATLDETEIEEIFKARTAKKTFYVDADATGADDGTSWADAFTDLNQALDSAESVDEVWVAEGVYTPHASDRAVAFDIQSGTTLYGGFDGTETSILERDWKQNPTILSGDLSGNDDANITFDNSTRAENSYTVVHVQASGAVIDGFSITGGHSNNGTSATTISQRGSAIYKESDISSLTLKNLKIYNNVSRAEGAVRLTYTQNGSLHVENCILHHNFSTYGSGLFIAASSNGKTLNANILGSLFYQNEAGNISGTNGLSGSSLAALGSAGGIINVDIINNTFADNKDFGAGTTNDKGTLILREYSNWDNSEPMGKLYANVHNNIFYNNLESAGTINTQAIGQMNLPNNKPEELVFTHNITAQTNLADKADNSTISDNLDIDPMFVDAAGEDYSLTSGSGAIDAGDDSKVPDEFLEDLAENVRKFGTAVDLGVYEFGAPPINKVAPTAKGKDFTISLDANGTANIEVADIEDGSSDDDTATEDLEFALDQTTFGCDHLGENQVILSVTDASQNTGTDTVTVTVLDEMAPSMSAQNLTLELDAQNQATITPDQVDNGSADNCDIAELTLRTTTFGTDDVGANELYLIGEDGSGNKDSVAFTVTVNLQRIRLDTISFKPNQIRLAPDANLGFKFSLPIANDFDGSQVTLSGAQAGNMNFTVSGAGTDSLVIDPEFDFFPNEVVTVGLFGLPAENGTFTDTTFFQFTTGLTIEGTSGTVAFEQTTLIQSGSPRRVHPVDLDGDGDMDIVTPFLSADAIVWFENMDNNFTFEAHIIIDGQDGAQEAKPADMDGDGDIDIVAYNLESQELYWLENDGNQSFARHVIATQMVKGRALDMADFDQDGDLDIAHGLRDEGTVHLWTNDGSGKFTSELVADGLTNVSRVFARDFDNDGRIDIMGLDYLMSKIFVMKNTEAGFELNTFSLASYTATDRGSTDATVYDFDDDGDLDVLCPVQNFSNFASGFSIYYENDGDGNFSAAEFNLFEIDGNRSFAAGDLDADGSTDVVFGDHRTTDLFWGYLDLAGENVRDNARINSSVDGFYATNAADFDGDGDLDLVVAGLDNNQVAVYNNKFINVDPPVLANELSDVTVDEDSEPYTIDIDGTFTDANTITYSARSSDEGVAATVSGTELTLTLEENFFGTATITVIADNGTKSANTSFEMIVNGVDDLPFVSNPAADITMDEDGEGRTINLSGVFTEPDNDAVTYSARVLDGSDLISLELTDALLSISGIENAFGNGEVELSIADAQGGEAKDTILVTINPVNDAPLFELSRELIEVGKDFSEAETITLTDLSPANESDQTITYSLDPSTVAFASVSFDAASGEVSITAIAGQFGEQAFTITADDGQAENNTATGTFELRILNNQPPVVESAVEDQTFEEDASETLLVADLNSLFSDPENEELTITFSSDNADIGLIQDGSALHYEVAEHYFGSAVITITANDGSSSTSQDFALTITAVNDAPVVNNPAGQQSATQDESFSYTLPEDQFMDVDNATLQISTSDVPAWLSYDESSATFSGTPRNDDVGTYTITITASDGELSATDELTIVVENVNDAPTFTSMLDAVEIEEDVAPFVLVDLDDIVVDVDGDALTFAVTSTNPAVTASLNTDNELEITPLPDANGAGTLTITVADASASAQQEVQITVLAVNDAPLFELSETEVVFDSHNAAAERVEIVPGAVPEDETEQTVTYSVLPESSGIATVVISGTSIEITPVDGAVGSEVFTITADDGQTENNMHQVELTVEVAEVLTTANKPSMAVYPNPAVDYLNILDGEIKGYEIYSTDGRLMMSGVVDRQRVDVSGLQPGIYSLRLVGDAGELLVSRFIKQ